MKDQLASYFRHALTGAATLGTFLGAHAVIDVADASQVNADAAQAAPLIASIAAAILSRVGLALVAKYAPSLSRLLGWSKSNVGALLLSGGTAVACCALPSCVTVVDPAGSKTTKPDTETISTVGALALSVVEFFRPAPKPEPVVTPLAVEVRSGK